MKNQVPIYKPEENPGFIPDAIYNSQTPIRNVSYEEQCPGSTVQVLDNSFNDDVAQYLKSDQPEMKRVLNQAMIPDFDPSNPPSIGRQDSDPKGG
jgi:hypothetical protein